MNFCSNCGHAVTLRIPDGDNRLRYCCPSCKTIHYQNPKLVVGTVPIWRDQVLLCKRAIEPRRGYWTLPAGFMEIGETADRGALRETVEEAGANVLMGNLFSVLDVVQVEQVHLFYLAQLQNLNFAAGIESLDVKLFSEAEIPWNEIAFRTVSATLRFYFQDRIEAKFSLHTGSITAAPVADVAASLTNNLPLLRTS